MTSTCTGGGGAGGLQVATEVCFDEYVWRETADFPRWAYSLAATPSPAYYGGTLIAEHESISCGAASRQYRSPVDSLIYLLSLSPFPLGTFPPELRIPFRVQRANVFHKLHLMTPEGMRFDLNLGQLLMPLRVFVKVKSRTSPTLVEEDYLISVDAGSGGCRLQRAISCQCITMQSVPIRTFFLNSLSKPQTHFTLKKKRKEKKLSF